MKDERRRIKRHFITTYLLKQLIALHSLFVSAAVKTRRVTSSFRNTAEEARKAEANPTSNSFFAFFFLLSSDFR